MNMFAFGIIYKPVYNLLKEENDLLGCLSESFLPRAYLLHTSSFADYGTMHSVSTQMIQCDTHDSILQTAQKLGVGGGI